MPLVSLTYTSEVNGGVDIEGILEVSRKRNTKDGITGVLFFRYDHYIQCLEGSREAVNKAYARIIRDERHKHLLILDYRDIFERSFPGWSMGYLSESSACKPTLLKYSVSQDFLPRELAGESSLRMLTELGRKVITA